jgi:hypothetical protein
MTKRLIKTAIIALLLSQFILFNALAQVTIGVNQDTENGAALEIKKWQVTNPTTVESLANAEEGILYPKVLLQKYNELKPLNNTPTDNEKLLATGMIVYNVNPAAESIEIGLNVWDGTEWRPLSSATGLAEISVYDCDNTSVQGFL